MEICNNSTCGIAAAESVFQAACGIAAAESVFQAACGIAAAESVFQAACGIAAAESVRSKRLVASRLRNLTVPSRLQRGP